MQQALDLFELLQARKSKEAEKAVTVKAQPVARAPARAEPLSYLTLGTVEGIIGNTSPDTLQEQMSWEGKMEKYMRLSHTYSSDNTISGEKCYMVDEALYKDILLAVAACKQNKSVFTAASEKLEQHLNQIEDSHNRVIQREKNVIDQFVAGITLSQAQIRAGHSARMKAVMADILALKDSIDDLLIRTRQEHSGDATVEISGSSVRGHPSGVPISAQGHRRAEQKAGR